MNLTLGLFLFFASPLSIFYCPSVRAFLAFWKRKSSGSDSARPTSSSHPLSSPFSLSFLSLRSPVPLLPPYPLPSSSFSSLVHRSPHFFPSSFASFTFPVSTSYVGLPLITADMAAPYSLRHLLASCGSAKTAGRNKSLKP